MLTHRGADFVGGRLLSQCRRMLEFTPDSFVFLYSRDGVHVVPAVDVVATDGTRPRTLYRHTVGSFFHEHFRCFIGDTRIHAVDQATLVELAPTGAMRALVVSVTEGPS